MKKKMLTLALLLTMSLGSIFANNTEGVSASVLNSFRKDFNTAKEIKWDISRDFVKATFTMNDQVMFAYYSQEGKLMGVIRNIVSSQLPINLLADLKNHYNDFWISDLFEMASGSETTYYVTLENADSKIVLKSAGSTDWSVYKREKKNMDQ